MAVYKLNSLYPTNPETPKNGTRFILTRRRATDLLNILKKEYPQESVLVTKSIDYELKNGRHESHISFILDDDDVDGFTALTYACMSMTFNLMETYHNDNN